MQKLNSKKWPKKAGIYCIINLIDGKRYVGSAVNLNERLNQHYHELSTQKHFNDHLQRSWNKYGEKNFKAFIVKSFNKIEYSKLLKVEDKYIKEWNLLDQNLGYNKRTNDSFPVLSKNSIEKRSKKAELRKKKVKAFYAETGKFYKEWNSITEAAAEVNDQTTNISDACKTLTKSVKGFVFIYSQDFDSKVIYKKQKANMAWTEERRKKQEESHVRSIRIYAYDSNGNFISKFLSFSSACRFYSLKKDSLSHLFKRYNKPIKYNSILFLKEKVDILEAKKLYNLAYEYFPGIARNQFSNK